MKTRVAILGVVSALVAATAAPQAQQAGTQSVRVNRTIELFEQKQPTFGIFSSNRSLDNARALARSGLDFVLIDMEHGPWSAETLQAFLVGMIDKQRVLQKGNAQPDVTPIVRIPANGRDMVTFFTKQALDMGAMGVMFPYISTREEAELAVRSMRYPQRQGSPDMEPRGIRGSGPTIASWFWGISNYVEVADVWPLDPRGELIAALQIETVEGVKNIDAILSVPGVSAIFVGPSDLSLSIGQPQGSPEVESAIQTVLNACRARGIPIGITTGANNVEERLKQGFNFITVGVGDSGITPATANTLQIARKVAGRQ